MSDAVLAWLCANWLIPVAVALYGVVVIATLDAIRANRPQGLWKVEYLLEQIRDALHGKEPK